jgi:SH3-like domain-containing protein
VTIEPPGANLRVVEPLDVATPKIGVYDQWIKVSDAAGREGYVAAWYVEAGPKVEGTEAVTGESEAKPKPSPEPKPEPVSEPLTVYVSESASAGLRMRSGPRIGADTVKILSPKTELTVLAGDESMVGVFQKWLNVCDPEGDEGFVAAWYVRK